MIVMDRRSIFAGAGASLGLALAGCNTTPVAQIDPSVPQKGKAALAAKEAVALSGGENYQALYGAVSGEKFPVGAVRTGVINPDFWRRDVDYRSAEAPGTIVVDPKRHYLYHITGNGRARRYGVGVGREGFAWSGSAAINSKQEWPDWYPPAEMIERQPDLKRSVAKLQSGLGVAGGPHNPLGARAMYLWQNNKDTLFRIHGTLEPGSIGHSVSSGCIRMVNQDVIDLYTTVQPGTKVVVL